MKIWTGGDREYSERVQRALFELGAEWDFRKGSNLCMPAHTGSKVLAVGVYDQGIMTHGNIYRLSLLDHCRPYRLADNGNLVPREANDDGWIEWHGGECPVDPDTEVEICVRAAGYGPNQKDSRPAGKLQWWHDLRASDVVAYRMVDYIFPTSQKLEQENDMQGETLTEAQALREVAQGHDDGDANPWNRVQYLSAGDEWMDLGSPAELDICVAHQTSLRRKPRTRRIEGEISEEAVRRLQNLRTGEPGLNAALDEILNAVQDQ